MRERGRDDQRKNCESLTPASNVLYLAALSFGGRLNHEAPVEIHLRLRFVLDNVHRQEIAKIDVFAGHDLVHRLSRNPRKPRANHERLLKNWHRETEARRGGKGRGGQRNTSRERRTSDRKWRGKSRKK